MGDNIKLPVHDQLKGCGKKNPNLVSSCALSPYRVIYTIHWTYVICDVLTISMYIANQTDNIHKSDVICVVSLSQAHHIWERCTSI